MNTIEVFLQGAGISQISIVKVPSDGHVRDLIEAAKGQGLKSADDEEIKVWIEDRDEPLSMDLTLADAGIKDRTRLHVHTCPRIKVTVNFQNKTESHPFAPSTTIKVVKKWADKAFDLSGVDAKEHALQLCNSSERPADDVHIGSLVKPRECELCFDLVPKQRVEG